MLSIFVPREVTAGETRVAATPETVRGMKDNTLMIYDDAKDAILKITEEMKNA
jgi:NAD/NADP transhydrogenase alpha subunit